MIPLLLMLMRLLFEYKFNLYLFFVNFTVLAKYAGRIAHLLNNTIEIQVDG